MSTQHPEPESERVALLFIVLLIIFTGFLILSGCVNKALVESYDQYLNTAGTEYIEYVDKDNTLDADSKLLRRINHEQAQKTVQKFKTTKWSW